MILILKKIGVIVSVFLSVSAFSQNLPSPRLPLDALPVPLHAQETDYSCGAAALLSVLYYWQVYDGSEKDLYAGLKTDPEYGTDGNEIVEVSKSFGLESAMVHDLTVEDLRVNLLLGTVPILGIQAWPLMPPKKGWREVWTEGHWVVLVGMDQDYAYFMDSAVEGAYVYVPLSELLERWHGWAISQGVDTPYQHLAILIRGIRPLRASIDRSGVLIRLE